MEEEKRIPVRTFDDFAECSEYYLDELSKIEEGKSAEFLNKKESKKLHDDVITLFFLTTDDLVKRTKAVTKANKVETKEFKKEFNEEHNSGVVQKTKSTFSVVCNAMKKALSPIKVLALPFKPLINKINSKLPPKVEVLDTTEQPKQLEQGQDASVSDTSSPASTSQEVADEVVEEENTEKNSQQKE